MVEAKAVAVSLEASECYEYLPARVAIVQVTATC